MYSSGIRVSEKGVHCKPERAGSLLMNDLLYRAALQQRGETHDCVRMRRDAKQTLVYSHSSRVSQGNNEQVERQGALRHTVE